MPQVYTWEQRKFDQALDEYARSLKQEKVPNALNRKGFFLTRRALNESPQKEPVNIEREMGFIIQTAHHRRVKLLYLIAASKAAKKWSGTKRGIQSGLKRKKKSWGKAWQKEVEKTAKRTLAGRKASTRFLRLGWMGSMMAIGKVVKNKSGAPYIKTTGIKQTGRAKGRAVPAKPGNKMVVTLTNLAESRSTAKRGGLVKAGSPALNRAFVEETKDIYEFMAKEAQKAADKANRQLR